MDDLTGYELVTTGWAAQAACKGLDPELFFPLRGHQASLAKQVCAACPVQTECAQYALTIRQKKGVWGGETEQQRRRQKTGRKPKKVPAAHGTETAYVRGCRCDRCHEAQAAAAHERRNRKVGPR